VDATGRGLGVRGVPVNGKADVDLDWEGKVILNQRGMSVVPAWRDLPTHLIPRRLKPRFPGAAGKKDDIYCFTIGEGPFSDGPLATGLDLVVDSPEHGNVVPHASVTLDQFQADLANTRDRWIIDEA
jgi:hypothetical protein